MHEGRGGETQQQMQQSGRAHREWGAGTEVWVGVGERMREALAS